MLIQTTTQPTKRKRNKLLIQYDGEEPISVKVGLETLDESKTDSADTQAEESKPLVSSLLKNGATLNAVYGGSNYVISGVANAKASDLAPVLQRLNLVNDPTIAADKSQQILDAAQSKVGASILIGAQAGALTFTLVEIAAPTWPMRKKLALSLLVALVISGAAYWVSQEEAVPVATPVTLDVTPVN